jgi:LacI family transcriptional regulator
MNQSQRITVKDVAKAAGVSPGTVSNALSGKRPVSEQTRQRVLDTIAELGYRPNLLARGLVNRQSGTLAVVAAGLEYYGPSRTLVGIEQQASELGYTLFLDLMHGSGDEDVDQVLDTLTAYRVDGIIWAAHEIGDNRSWVVEERLRQLPPLVFLTMESRPGLSVLSTNNQRGAILAIDHLFAQGNRKIGIITGPLDWWEARQRLDGWRTALLSHGLDPKESLVYEGNWSAASGQQGMTELMAVNSDLDAIFACNDQMAIGVLRAAHLEQIPVPDQLAVVGFDNIPEAPFFCPSLTSVRQHLTDLGKLAVIQLHAMVQAGLDDDAEAIPAAQLITPELIVRESSVGTG